MDKVLLEFQIYLLTQVNDFLKSRFGISQLRESRLKDIRQPFH